MPDWFVAPAAQSILDQATVRWPGRSRLSDGTKGDDAHAARTSDHNPDGDGEVLAADLTHDPANGCDAHAWAERTRQRCKSGAERRVKYQISNRRYYSANTGWEWAAYTGPNPHEKHVHTSINKGRHNDTSPWFGEEEMFTVGQFQEIMDRLPGEEQQKRDRNRVKATAKLARANNQMLDELVDANANERKVDLQTLKAARSARDAALLILDEVDQEDD